MAAPTLATSYQVSNWLVTTTPKTVNVSVTAGDILVVMATAESGDAGTINTPTGGTGITWTLQESYAQVGFTGVYIWTAPVPTTQSFTLSVTYTLISSTAYWGFVCAQFSGSSGVGASDLVYATTSQPSISLTTTSGNSALCVINADWDARDGAARVWSTPSDSTPSNETSYVHGNGHYTVYTAVYEDAGAVGSKTIGITTPLVQTYTIAAIEILGTVTVPPTMLAWYSF